MADLFDARYPVGARLPATGGENGRWRATTDSAGRGWRIVDSWPMVAAAARQAGAGGFALVRFRDSTQGPAGIHVASDGHALWITWVHHRTGLDFQLLDEHLTDDLPVPSQVAAIDYCTDVRTND